MFAWGKTGEDGKPSHHLAHHSLDVACVFAELATMPVFSQRLRRAASRAVSAEEVEWLASLVFLHDIGKLSPAFQAKGWDDLLAQRIQRKSHLTEGGVYFDHLLDDREGSLLDGVAIPTLDALHRSGDEDLVMTVVRLLLAHHGGPVGENIGDSSLFTNTVKFYDWHSEDAVMGKAMRRWFPKARPAPDIFCRAAFQHMFGGLLALADWVGSSEAHFPHYLPFDLDYNISAFERAKRALKAVGLADAQWPEAKPSFQDLTGYTRPRGAQQGMRDIPVDAHLVLLEAETGAGKTEAALSRFVDLRSAGVVDGLYFAVPTRAAATQLFERVNTAMDRIGASEAVLAVPGMLRAGAAKGERMPGFKVLWDDGRERWAAEHPTRFLGAPVAVGTIDQALMAGLQVKHAPLRAAAMSRSLLVIDEVHASDAYMNAIARKLVEGHAAVGGHALLMSATLAAEERARWMGTSPDPQTSAKSAPYPAIWHSIAPDRPAWHSASGAQKDVLPALVPTMDPRNAARLAIKHARAGADVLVIRNTVDFAVATYDAVVEEAPGLCMSINGKPALHHARFAAEDRQALDEAVENALGKSSEQRGGRIVIGTQTLEQSLDIDADLLITDLCPMDVLLQRVGRLHRHVRSDRPQRYSDARTLVMVPENGLDRLAQGPAFENGIGAWQEGGTITGVYIDLRALESTRRIIEERTQWSIPKDNRALVESALHSESLALVEQEMNWSPYSRSVVAKALAESQAGDIRTLDRSSPFPEAFPTEDETVQTRLGARGPAFALKPETQGIFVQSISTISPPARWCRGLTGDEEVKVHKIVEGGMIIEIDSIKFKYTRRGLHKSSEST